MNSVSLVGRLTREPEPKEVRGGSVCRLRIAVDNPGRGGERGEPTFVDVATFGKRAEACAADLAKGRQVAVGGRLVFRERTGRDGSERSARSIRGSAQLLGPKGAGGSQVDRGAAEEMALAI